MINTEQGRAVLWISLPIALLLTVSSLGGLCLPLTYAAETPLHAAQYLGNDAGNLLLVVPILLIVAFLALRGSTAARLIWMGTLVYLVYDFLGYAFATHFNSMFLAYCAVLGLSFFCPRRNSPHAAHSGDRPSLRPAHSQKDPQPQCCFSWASPWSFIG